MQVIIQRLHTLYFLKVPHLFIHTNIITAEHLFLCTLKAKKVISLSCIFFGHQLIRLYKAWISMNYFNYYIRADVLVESSQSYPKSLRIFSVSTSVNLFFQAFNLLYYLWRTYLYSRHVYGNGTYVALWDHSQFQNRCLILMAFINKLQILIIRAKSKNGHLPLTDAFFLPAMKIIPLCHTNLHRDDSFTYYRVVWELAAD